MGPDVKLSAGGKRVGREMEAVGENVKTPNDADEATTAKDISNSLAKAVRDKALDYMREGVSNSIRRKL